MDKTSTKDMTKAQMADYASIHFGVVVNRKKSRSDVEKQFKVAEKEYILDKQHEEEEKMKATVKKQEDTNRIAEKQQEKIEEKISYPCEIKDEEGDTVMHRPCKGGLCLGDPPTRQVVDGETVTNSAPHLKQD